MRPDGLISRHSAVASRLASSYSPAPNFFLPRVVFATRTALRNVGIRCFWLEISCKLRIGWSEETGLETVAVTVGTHVSL